MSTTIEQKYFEILNIPSLSINQIKKMIKSDIKNTINCWENGRDVEKQAFHIIGPAGVGKTQINNQIAKELSEELGVDFQIMMIKAPVLSRDDFIIPFPVIKDNEQSFKMLYSDFVPKDPDSYGIFVIDEFSRGDHSLQQLLWQVQNEYAVHTKPFPKGWFVISVDNPDDSEYSMDTMEDAAGLRRQLHVYTEVSARDFLEYAVENNFHKLVVEFVQANPEKVYDFKAQKFGSVYANPASWEKLSHHLWKFEMNGSIADQLIEIENIAGGLINTSMTALFMEFVNDNEKLIKPQEIFNNYKKVEKKINAIIKSNDNAKLGDIMVGFFEFMVTSMPDYNQDKSNKLCQELSGVAKFLGNIPIDTAAIFATSLDQLDRKSKSFKYMTILHNNIMKRDDKYKKNFYDALVKCSNK